MRAVVIGGGVGGLAAAYELTKAGHEVRLVEAGPVLGGQVRTSEIGGGRIESFYHHLFRSDLVIAELIEELGLGEDLEWVESHGGMLAEGRIYRARARSSPCSSPRPRHWYRRCAGLTDSSREARLQIPSRRAWSPALVGRRR